MSEMWTSSEHEEAYKRRFFMESFENIDTLGLTLKESINLALQFLRDGLDAARDHLKTEGK